MNPEELRHRTAEFLEALRGKPEEDRSPFEALLLETGEAFLSKLSRYCAKHGESPVNRSDRSVLQVLTAYNEINRDYDLADVDLQLAKAVRKGRR